MIRKLSIFYEFLYQSQYYQFYKSLNPSKNPSIIFES